ncbi:DUF6194 family protein [Nocardia sp. NPDC005746]|uniref:DUF6194 family protein n=1 Tax=Nocardia sp. NPDC005746 TaxID=3157062 RepID=UPI0033C17E72
MDIEEITRYIESLDGVLTLAPGPDSAFPEIAWGDRFFYYAPDGQVPARTQPFATIITKDYPDDATSQLNRPGIFRLNISVGRDAFIARLGHTPREGADHPRDPAEVDSLFPHPVYAGAAWLSVINPDTTAAVAKDLLALAHDRART